MKDVLARAQEDELERLAWSNTLLAFDYDGTLAPIMDDPSRALMRRDTRLLLARVARLYPCIVISGRARRDAVRFVRGVPVFEVLGNHGIEPWDRRADFAARVRGWLPRLASDLRGVAGVVIEGKGLSVSIHYRAAPIKTLARERIRAAAARIEGARLIGGKCVLNLVPAGAPHKGTALEAARMRLGCDSALYVGDDETDEDVFRTHDPRVVVTVRVGRTARSRARFFVRSQRNVDALLARLVALRQRPAC
jgi:trehalose 6-phosphate phosphatase